MECTCAKFKIGDKVKFSTDGGFYTTYISMAIILGLDKYQSDLDPDISMTFTVIGFNSEDEIYALTDDLGREFMASDKYAELVNQWTIYNNTLPLCELTDEQAAMLFNAWRKGGEFQYLSNLKWLGVGDSAFVTERDRPLRIKPKSERELFIEAAIGHGIKPETQSPKQIFGELFDSGKFKYIDNTQHFGENI